MNFSKLRTRLAVFLFALLVGVTITVSTASAASLPTLGTRLYYYLGSVLFGGMSSTASSTLDTTSVAGFTVALPKFASATTLTPVTNSTASAFPYKGTFVGYLRGTGSTTLRYGAGCFRNPLNALGAGSGIVARLDYHAGNNPAGLGGDIGFVKSCTGHSAANTNSGSDLINDTCTATGCVSSYTTATAAFNGADYIKFTPRGNLTSSYTGRITVEIVNIWGE